jgi:biotin carboxylase
MSVLLIHTSNASRRRHLATARRYLAERGERLLVMVKRPTWESEFADRVIVADTANIADAVAAARAVAAEEPVHGVLALVEHSVPAAAAVAAALGLPSISPQTAYRARDKFAMRTAFARGGLRQPPFAVAATVAEAVSEARSIGYPLVLKPVLGGGSKHVRRIDTEAELVEHFDRIRLRSWDGGDHDPLTPEAMRRYRRGLLLEGYLPGGEVSVESLVVDGRTRVIAVHDKPMPMLGPYFEEVFYTTPTTLPADVRRRIAEATASAHEALGIRTGVTHTEFRIGADSEPVILETAARLGGGPVYRSVLLSAGVDMVEAALDLALGRPPAPVPEASPHLVGFCMFFADRAGRVRAVHGVDEVRSDPRVHELELYRSVGDHVDVPPMVSQAHAHAIFSADSHEALHRTFDELVKTLRFEVE